MRNIYWQLTTSPRSALDCQHRVEWRPEALLRLTLNVVWLQDHRRRDARLLVTASSCIYPEAHLCSILKLVWACLW